MSVTAVPLQPVKTSYKIWLAIGVLVAIAAAFGLAWLGTRDAVHKRYNNEDFLAWHKTQPGIKTTASGLQYEVLTPGTGDNAKEQDGVALEIVGHLRDGSEFQPKAPMRFQIGQPMIPGFTEGVKLMNKGAKYRFWLPPNLGYGGVPGAEQQPGNELATKVLVFDVEMKELVPAAVIQQMMMQQQMQQQQQGGAPGGTGGAGGGIPEGAPQGAPGEQ